MMMQTIRKAALPGMALALCAALGACGGGSTTATTGSPGTGNTGAGGGAAGTGATGATGATGGTGGTGATASSYTIGGNVSGLSGLQPNSAPTLSPGGILPLYGSTLLGGTSNQGTVYEMFPDTAVEILHSFTGGSDGGNPDSRLVVTSNGTIYGTTTQGANGVGTLFSISPSGSFQVLHAFAASSKDLAVPGQGRLMQASDGNIYGTAGFGGASGDGGVFEYNISSQTYSILASFGGAAAPNFPSGGLVQVGANELYGVSYQGGTYGEGTLYKVDMQTGAYTTLYSFPGGAVGVWPAYTPCVGDNGNLFITVTDGMTNGAGQLVEVSPNGTLVRVVESFQLFSGLHQPDGPLVVGTNGWLYGSAGSGGGGIAEGGLYAIN